MRSKKMSLLYWVLAIFFAILIMIFQRITGPTNPVRGKIIINGEHISYKFLRSSTANLPFKISLTVKSQELEGYLYARRYDGINKYKFLKTAMQRKGNMLIGKIKGEDIAGKVEYLVKLVDKKTKKEYSLNKGKSIIARFKGAVPAHFLFSHIFFMILSFIFAMRTLLETLRKDGDYYWLVNWTLVIVFIGGMILGPIVQYYAFSDFWTGIPFGTDLTDNKILIAFIFWLIAFFMKKKSKYWVIAAVLIMMIVYSIPHSVLGSERNYKTGTLNNKFSKLNIDYKSLKFLSIA